MTLVFYLKVNRDVEYTLSNLRAWIEAISCLSNSKIFILSDNDSLDDKIEERILPDFSACDISMMESDRDTEELKTIAETVTIPHWYNCACSHLTTFFHSKQNGYNSFWNIDADDTFFCVSKERLAEILINAQKYADDMQVGCFSLDMWTSRNRGFAWSFGVTYTSNNIDWVNTMLAHRNDPELNTHFPGHTKNLDLYFTYLRDTQKELNIGTFCVENLRFVHYGNDMYRNPIGTGFFHWKDGYLRFPLLFFFYGSRSLGKYEIPEDVVLFNINITDKESYALIKPFFAGYNVETERLFKERPYYTRSSNTNSEGGGDLRLLAGENSKYVLFGCGNEGRAMLRYLGKDRVRCFVDNKRCGMTVDGKPVISFDELMDMDFKGFTLLVTALNGYSEIIKQLEENGVYNYQLLPYTETSPT